MRASGLTPASGLMPRDAAISDRAVAAGTRK